MKIEVAMRSGAPRRGAQFRVRSVEPIVWVAVVSLVLPARADAYLDPGTGSLVIQAIIGVLLALRLTSKIWWRRSKRLLQRIFRPGSTPTTPGE